MIAGSIGGGSSAGVGAANATLVHTDRVEAYVGEGAQVAAAGADGLSLNATSMEELITVTASGGFASTAGVSGSAAVNVLDETTQSFIGRGATISAEDAADDPGILLHASDDTTIVAVAGSLAAGTAAVGVGADVGVVTKRTQAYIDSGVTAHTDGSIVIEALSTEDITSVAAGVSVGTVGIGLDASVHVINVTTRAFIGDDPTDDDSQNPETLSSGAGHVHAQGDIVVWADDSTEEDKVVGVLAAGTVGVGAAGAVTVTDKTTEAFVGQGAWVTAEGKSPEGHEVRTGAFTAGVDAGATTFDPNNAEGSAGIESGGVGANPDIDNLKAQGDIKAPQLGAMDAKQDGGDDLRSDSFKRTVTAGTSAGFHGLAVSATNKDDIATFTFSVGGGTVGVGVSAGVNVVTTGTKAYIGGGANVNEELSGAGASQSVLVAAGNDFKELAVAGTLGAGTVGVAPAVGVTVLANSTEARHRRRGDRQRDGRRSRPGPRPGGHADRRLRCRRRDGRRGRGRQRRRHRQCHHRDDRRYRLRRGRRARARDGRYGDRRDLRRDRRAASWASAVPRAWCPSRRTRRRRSGTAPHVDALGGGRRPRRRPGRDQRRDGFREDDGPRARRAGGVHRRRLPPGRRRRGGVRRGVGRRLRDAHRLEHRRLDRERMINQSDPDQDLIVNEAADPGQDVVVAAANKVSATTFAGAIAGGFVGVGGAVDVGSVKNDTSAGIRSGAVVNSADDVLVYGLGIKEVDGFAVSGAGGSWGCSASVSVWSIGSGIEKNYSDNEGNTGNATEGENGSADADAARQSQAASNQVSGLLKAGVGETRQGDDEGERVGGHARRPWRRRRRDQRRHRRGAAGDGRDGGVYPVRGDRHRGTRHRREGQRERQRRHRGRRLRLRLRGDRRGRQRDQHRRQHQRARGGEP